MADNKPKSFPDQHQQTPGLESKMKPEPEVVRKNYKGSDKLKGKAAVITGGDSGIGRAVAVHFAKEGADVAIMYYNEHSDAEETKKMVEAEGRRCILIPGDLKDRDYCKKAIEQAVKELGKLNILVNNAAEQHPHDSLEELDLDIMEQTFRTNIFAMFYLTKAAIKHLKEGDCILNTTSVTAYYGKKVLLDYSATKGAITAFTRSLSELLAEKKIRVNGVAPGPIWTPLIPSTFDDVTKFGADTPLGRAGQPSEVAPAYVFLASEDASYITGQIIHPNGGSFITT
ncbi:MAG TPA: SDR family oxidoreductase [Ignavibacteriaceae bacterium]|nr:SDR family oxidoreductase [Ignavibacteriaceae bacterium]